MSTFPRTRAAAASIARHTPGEPARARAAAFTALQAAPALASP